MAPTLFLYIGPPKTASTFLQRGFLQNVDELECQIRPKVQIGKRVLNFSDLFLCFPEVWNGVGRNHLKQWTEPAFQKGRDLVVSSEGIYGGVATPRPWAQHRTEWLTSEVNVLREPNGFPSHASSAAHLRAVADTAADLGFAETKILTTVRRQDQKLASGYAEMSSNIADASQANFEEWITKLMEDPIGRYALGGEKLNYLSWWKEASAKLGNDNILLLPMELLGADQNAFLGQWLDFLGLRDLRGTYLPFGDAETNRMRVSSKSERTWALRPPARGIRTIPFRALQKVGLLSAAKRWSSFPKRDEVIRLTEETSEKILAVYEEPNRELDNRIDNIDLHQYGYYQA